MNSSSKAFSQGNYKIRGVMDAMKRAAVSALNKFAKKVVVMLRRKAMEKYNLQRKHIDRHVTINKASFINGIYSVSISVDGAQIALTEFNPKKSAHGITVQITRGQVTEIVGAFKGKAKVGRLGDVGRANVFLRKGEKRLPIREGYGPFIADLLRSKEMEADIKQLFEREFYDLLASEFKFYLSKA